MITLLFQLIFKDVTVELFLFQSVSFQFISFCFVSFYFAECNKLTANIPGEPEKSSHPGGGYLVYLSDGDVPFFRVSFSLIFSRTGYQKKANFLEQVVKACQKRKFC